MDISIDLETLALTPDAFICSIGAVSFNIVTGTIIDKFYIVINLDHTQSNRVIDPSTVKWWLTQPDQARNELTMARDTYSLDIALSLFDNWIKSKGGPVVWGNGATFDIAILDHAFNYNSPWKFYNVNDMRTILRHAQSKGYKKPDFIGVKHNALVDAQYQAKVISQCWNY